MRNAELESIFPGLRITPYGVTSPVDENYNCISHAANDPDRPFWWWPTTDAYWPDDLMDDSVDNFTRIFCEHLGYGVCTDGELEAGYEKVAIYAVGSRTTHMARQLPDGSWTSKLGQNRDISHTLPGVENKDYGTVVRFLKRLP